MDDGVGLQTGLRGLLGVTGTPGTGKKTVAPILASLLGKRPVDLNSLAQRESRLVADGECEVDTERFRSRILRLGLSEAVVFGHLLPDVFERGELEFVAVLRCEPRTLRRRLEERGYAGRKLEADLEAELIGVTLDQSVRRFGGGAVREYDATRARPENLARRIAKDYAKGAKGGGPWVDWTLSYTSSTRLRSLFSSARTDEAST